MKKTKAPNSDIKKHAAQASALLKQLANEQRLLILCNLVNGELAVSDMQKTIDLSQSALSQHLAKMRTAGLVEADKRGQKIYYRIASTEVRAMLSTLHLIYCRI